MEIIRTSEHIYMNYHEYIAKQRKISVPTLFSTWKRVGTIGTVNSTAVKVRSGTHRTVPYGTRGRYGNVGNGTVRYGTIGTWVRAEE